MDRLQVSRQEVRAVSLCLLAMLIGFEWIPALQDASMKRLTDYSEQDRIFLERTAEARARHREWVERVSWVDSLEQNPLPSDQIPSGRHTVSVESEQGSSDRKKDEDASGDRLDLNHASAEAFRRLPGIGPVYAERMVRWRQQFGPYLSVDQLIEIRGIGPKRLEALRSRVRVSSVHPDSL
ncbi:MAG: helix-hairpin-helix domain-containing protein [Balneolaceae bacterium]